MESDIVKSCECGWNCFDSIHSNMNLSYSKTWLRSVKRKLDELESDREKYDFFIPGLSIPEVAKVEIENECGVLREMVTTQQETIQKLSIELDQERNAASSAANEAMSMILRLQREKAEIQMDARQFKLLSEEKMAHDQQEIAAMEELLYKREQTSQSLTCEIQAFKYQMMSYGFTESEADGEKGVFTCTNSVAGNSEIQLDFLTFNYPPLKCNSNKNHTYPESENENESETIEKFSFNETPQSLIDIEQRINQLEKSQSQSPRQSQPVLKNIIVAHSPKRHKPPSSRFSTDNAGSFFATIKEDLNSSFKKVENASEFGDEMSDRIYTIDSIHYGASKQSDHNDSKGNMSVYDDFMSISKDSTCKIEDPEVMKLYVRLHALEADRESMRQAITNMRTDKAQLVLLKEIAQHLCKEMQPVSRMPVKKGSVFGSFFAFSMFKSVPSIVFRRRKASGSKYMNASNPGMLMLFDKGPQVGQWRCLSRTQL